MTAGLGTRCRADTAAECRRFARRMRCGGPLRRAGATARIPRTSMATALSGHIDDGAGVL